MKYFKIIILLVLSPLIISCGTISEGFKSPKKNQSDEFLVEKKSPLVLPPEFNELPIPNEKGSKKINNTKNIEDLINNNETKTNATTSNSDLEGSILEKIKKN